MGHLQKLLVAGVLEMGPVKMQVQLPTVEMHDSPTRDQGYPCAEQDIRSESAHEQWTWGRHAVWWGDSKSNGKSKHRGDQRRSTATSWYNTSEFGYSMCSSTESKEGQ